LPSRRLRRCLVCRKIALIVEYPWWGDRSGDFDNSSGEPPCRRMTPWWMAPRPSNSAGPSFARSSATRWRAPALRWRSSNVNALTIGVHEPRSTPRRRSQMEPSGPGRHVTTRGRHTGRQRQPAMQDRLRRAKPRLRPGRCGVPPSPGQSHSGQTHPRISRSRRTDLRALGRRRSHRRSRPHRAVADPRASGRGGRPEALPGRPARRWAGGRAGPPAGRVAPVIPDGVLAAPMGSRPAASVVSSCSSSGRRRVAATSDRHSSARAGSRGRRGEDCGAA